MGLYESCWCWALMTSWVHRCIGLNWKWRSPPSFSALGQWALFHHDNHPKHTSKVTFGFLKKNRVEVNQCHVCLLIWTQSNTSGGFWREEKTEVAIQSLKEVKNGKMKRVKVAKCLQHVHVMPRRLGAVIKIHLGHTSAECSSFWSGVYSFLLHPNFSKTDKSVV